MDRKKLTFRIALIGAALLVGVGLIMVFSGNQASGTETSDDSSSFVTFLPIWAAMIPTIVANRTKYRDESSEDQKRKAILLIVTGLTILAVIGTIFYILLSY